MKQQSYIRFIVIGSARSGTTFLQTLIGSHDRIICHGEIFHLLSKRHSSNLDLIVTNPIGYVSNNIYRQYTDLIAAVGYKMVYSEIGANNIFLSEMDTNNVAFDTKVKRKSFSNYMLENYDLDEIRIQFAEFQDWIRDDVDLKVIHIMRSNKLETYLSFRLAGISAAWNSLSGNYATDPINLDHTDCIQFFERTIELEQTYVDLFKEHDVLDVSYDRLSEDPNNCGYELQDFLEVERQKLTSPLKKQNRRTMSEMIANYEELKDYFSNTEWSQYFK